MIEELINKSGLSEDDILTQCLDEYERGYNLMVNIREKWEEDLKLYNNQKVNKEKIGDNTVYSIHSAFMARMFTDKPTTQFYSERLGSETVLANLNSTRKQDYDEEDMQILEYQELWDVGMFGVSVTAKEGWDGLRKKNVFESVDPRNWIPDPDGNYFKGEYSYTGFEKKVYEYELKSMGYDPEELGLVPSKTDYRGPDYNQERDQIREGLNPGYVKNNPHNKAYTIYYHFSYFEGIPAMVITGNNNKVFIDTEILKPIYDWEKKDGTLIPFPFSFKYIRPVKGSPVGRSIPDDVGDVQRAKAMIANLRLDKSHAELYPMYIYNSRLIKNRADLDFGFNKMIAANPLEGESLSNALTPVQKDFRADNSYIIDQSLDQQAVAATSLGNVSRGSSPERREAATTNRLIQDNTDINLALITKTINIGEEQKVRLWLRGYLEHFTNGDSKYININTGFGIVPKKISKEEFLINDYLKIEIISNSEADERKSRERDAYAATLPILQTLERPKASQNYSYRRFLEVSGVPKEQIEIEIPLTPQEIIARENIELLLNGEFVDIDPSYEPLTHLIALKAAGEGLNVELYREGLLELYKTKGGEETKVSESVQNNTVAQAQAQLGAQTDQTL